MNSPQSTCVLIVGGRSGIGAAAATAFAALGAQLTFASRAPRSSRKADR
jgi:NAD(P)-dependent dehydrogenase (short-subunit alcohol dehydrogenase family)